MTCNDKCIHYLVCEQKKYDFANIDECMYYTTKNECNEWTSVCTGTCYGRDTFSAEDMRGAENEQKRT